MGAVRDYLRSACYVLWALRYNSERAMKEPVHIDWLFW